MVAEIENCCRKKPISIIRDTTRSGRLMRGAVACGTWYRYAGGPVGIKIDGNHIWSVRVDTVRALLQRYGYAVEEAS